MRLHDCKKLGPLGGGVVILDVVLVDGALGVGALNITATSVRQTSPSNQSVQEAPDKALLRDQHAPRRCGPRWTGRATGEGSAREECQSALGLAEVRAEAAEATEAAGAAEAA